MAVSRYDAMPSDQVITSVDATRSAGGWQSGRSTPA